jgi:hypothetical protein
MGFVSSRCHLTSPLTPSKHNFFTDLRKFSSLDTHHSYFSIFIIYKNFGRHLAGNFRNIYLLILCCVQINYSIAFFFLRKSNMVNDVPENDDFDGLNSVFSWRCGLWSPRRFPYSLQVLGQSCYFQTRANL